MSNKEQLNEIVIKMLKSEGTTPTIKALADAMISIAEQIKTGFTLKEKHGAEVTVSLPRKH